MIDSYSEYIKRYLLAEGLGHRYKRYRRPIPGEHHFVAVYLLHRLFEISSLVPDYINPDGGKDVLGDVVYYRDHKHHFSIEVKLDVIRLTKGEFNRGIVSGDDCDWPDLFLGVGKTGLVLMAWDIFRGCYKDAVVRRDGMDIMDKFKSEIDSGYGPQMQVDVLMSSPHVEQYCYLLCEDSSKQNAYEHRFRAELKAAVARLL